MCDLTYISKNIFKYMSLTSLLWTSLVAQKVKNLPPMQETQVPSLGQEDPLDPLQHSCLENSMNRGAWWATVHRVIKSQTQLND